MSKRVIIVHRWDARPADDWYGWLGQKLVTLGHEVQIPEMPRTEAPVIKEWVEKLKEVVGKADENTILIGHSIGCQTIVRLAAELEGEEKLGGALMVAPWINLVNLDGPESEAIAKPWSETPIDWDKAKAHLGEVVCLMSDNDPWVKVSEGEIFREKLGAEIKILNDQGHFTQRENEEILAELRRIK